MTPKIVQKETVKSFQRGFTFIELLIVILIMSLLFGLGYANYRTFARRKATEDVVTRIVGELRHTQQISSSVKKPLEGVCKDSTEDSMIEKYEFTIDTGKSFEYKITGFCKDGSFESKIGDFILKDEVDTTTEITKSHSNPIVFKVLGDGSNLGGTTFTITDIDGNSYTIDISETGAIKSSL